ncbi:MAG: hypothetical protein AAB383_02885 [Patescibacteria group bacterium]
MSELKREEPLESPEPSPTPELSVAPSRKVAPRGRDVDRFGQDPWRVSGVNVLTSGFGKAAQQAVHPSYNDNEF